MVSKTVGSMLVWIAALMGCTGERQIDAQTYRCAAPPPDLAACTQDVDCAIVATGCYCGAQPVVGVAAVYVAAAGSCERAAATTCALGCAVSAMRQTQDGKTVAENAPINVRCDGGACKTSAP
jgi:hypothetical protein